MMILFQEPEIDKGLINCMEYVLYTVSMLRQPKTRGMFNNVLSYLHVSKIPLTKALHIPNSKTGNKWNGHIPGQLEIKVSYLLGYLRDSRGIENHA